MNLILVFLLSAIAAYGEISFGTASRIRRGAGAPSSGDCAVASDVGKVYIQNDLAASGSPIFACSNSGASSYSWQQATGGGGGGGGATTALDNLASVSINASLIPQSAKNLGAAATPWQTICWYGSGTFGSHSWCTAGTPTGNRTLTFPDASITVAGSASALTSTRVPFATTGGLLTDSAGFTFSDAANVRLATIAGGSSQSTAALFDITNSAGSSHWLTVLGDGKVGIGTNAPASLLHVTGTSPEMRLVGTGTGSGDLFTINLLNSIYSAQITHGGTSYSGLGGANSLNLYTIGAGALTLGTASVERGRITAAGAWGIGTSNATPAASTTLSILDATPASGATTTWIGHDGSGTYSGVHLSALTTSLKVVAGLTQGSTNLQEWQSSAGTVLAAVNSSGYYTADVIGGAYAHYSGNIGASLRALNSGAQDVLVVSKTGDNITRLRNDGPLVWSATTDAYGGTPDTSLSRCTSTAGCVAVGTGAAGSTAGTLRAQLIQPALSTVTFSATPTFDLSLGNTVKITLTANVTSSTWSNQRAGQETTLIVCQNGTGGFTFAFPAATLGAFTIGATASKCSTQKFVSDGTNLIAQGVGTIDI